MTLFTNEMDDIMKQHDAEVEGLRQHVLDVEYSSAALEKRAKSAEEYAQMMEEYGMMQEKRVTVAVKTVSSHTTIGRWSALRVGGNGRPWL